MTPPEVALVTYSTKPRGGVVHTLALAEALHAAGAVVRVVALGDPDVGFYREVSAPVTVVPAGSGEGTLEDRVAESIDRLTDGLADVDAAILHSQDCISARAAARVRDAGADAVVVRTVHHVDDFTSQVLIDCQRAAILEPDAVLVVSETWRHIMCQEYGVSAEVVPNGVDVGHFRAASPTRVARLRGLVGAGDRPLLLAVGGIEPRKGSDTLIRAMSRLVRSRPGRPVLAMVGGHSFQDYREYRERVLGEIPGLGLELGRDVVLVGTVPDQDMPAWYAAADVLTFPSVKEGFGLAVLEAMAAGTPVVASDLPVFHEYLDNRRNALLVPTGDDEALAGAISEVLDDAALRAELVVRGAAVAERFSWAVSARRHREIYARLPRRAPNPTRR